MRITPAAVAATALVLTLSLAACGGTTSTNAAAGTRPKTPSASASATVAAAQYDTTWGGANKTTYDHAAVAWYGQKHLDAAASEVDGIVKQYGFNSNLIFAKGAQERSALMALCDKLTPKSKADWTKQVNSYVAKRNNSPYFHDVVAFTLVHIHPIGSKYKGKWIDAPKSGPGVVNPRISSTAVSLANNGDLLVAVHSSGDLRVTHDGKAKLWHAKHTLDMALIKTATGWRIEGWTADIKLGSTLTLEH